MIREETIFSEIALKKNAPNFFLVTFNIGSPIEYLQSILLPV